MVTKFLGTSRANFKCSVGYFQDEPQVLG